MSLVYIYIYIIDQTGVSKARGPIQSGVWTIAQQKRRERGKKGWGGGIQTDLLHLPLVPLVRPGNIISQRFRTGEIMIRTRGSDDVALSCDLAGEPSYGSSDLVDLTEENHTRETTVKK